jgi:hypothetical protein
MKIGIDLNSVVRNVNKKYLEIYLKDINPTFDETKIDLNKTDILADLPFESKKKRKLFAYEDYPFEIFGQAPSCATHSTAVTLQKLLNDWANELYFSDGILVSVFSTHEEGLSIQATFNFLSKSGTRLRNVFLPTNIKEVWDEYDVVITADKEIVKNCPKNKVVVLIKKTDNDIKTDFVYNNLEEVISDEKLMNKILNKLPKPSLLTKIKHIFK